MISIIAEAHALVLEDKEISSLLDQYKKDYPYDKDHINSLQKSLDLLEKEMPKEGRPSLRLGVEAIGEALAALSTLHPAKDGGWKIYNASDGKQYQNAILTQQMVRSWYWDQQIKPAEIANSLDTLCDAGEQLRSVIDQGLGPGKFIIYNYSLANINQQLFQSLYEGGSKGKGYNLYGSYEKVLAVMTCCQLWPQPGSGGAGDIRVGDKLVEIKCLDGGRLRTKPVIPNGGMIALVESGSGGSINFQIFLCDDSALLDATRGANGIDLPLYHALTRYCSRSKSFNQVCDLLNIDTRSMQEHLSKRIKLLKRRWKTYSDKSHSTSADEVDLDDPKATQPEGVADEAYEVLE